MLFDIGGQSIILSSTGNFAKVRSYQYTENALAGESPYRRIRREMVGVIAADAQSKFTGRFETSSVNCRINLDLKEIDKEEKNYKPLPAYYDFGGKKEERLRQNFFRIGQEIQELVAQFQPPPAPEPPKGTMKPK